MSNEVNQLVEAIHTQQKTIKEMANALSSIGAAQFLIFRMLMQYDEKLASAFGIGLEKEVAKNKQSKSPFCPHYEGQLDELLKIAQNPAQRDEKGRPLWIHLAVDNTDSNP